MKSSIWRFANEFFVSGTILADLSENLIVPVPKVGALESLMQFRAISLCTVLYKMLTKTTINSLKAILPKVVNPTQCSFLPGRQILDNIIIIQDVLYSMSCRYSGKGMIILKFDLGKVYYRLN